jgi:hypothetical protein
VRAALVAALIFGAALASFACSDDGGDEPEAAATTEVTAPGGDGTTPTAGSAERRTGIPEVDAVIDALEARDVESLTAIVELQPVACIGPTPASLGALFCQEGEAEGAVSNVLPVSNCESSYVREPDVPETIGEYAGSLVGLYAVYPVDVAFALVYERSGEGDLATRSGTVTVTGGRIRALNYGCAQSPEELVESTGFGDPVLPPPG